MEAQVAINYSRPWNNTCNGKHCIDWRKDAKAMSIKQSMHLVKHAMPTSNTESNHTERSLQAKDGVGA